MKTIKFYGHFAAAFGSLWIVFFLIALLTQSHVNFDASANAVIKSSLQSTALARRAPNGGPTTSVGISGVTGGAPSVS